jgi:Uri superfamily endonuclease
VLVAFVAQMNRLEIGRLGVYDIVPGYYAYVGSAFGAGGLRARICHHLESTANYGKQTHNELCRWAGVDEHAPPRFRNKLKGKVNP